MKKKSIIVFLIVMLLFTNSLVFAKENKSNDKVYVIPIHGEINGATKNFVIEQINKLNNRDDVGCIIFDVNTYGGLIDKAIDIKDAIISTDIKTISYVNNKAESAGVLLTIASEDIAVAQNATIGSAETIPNTEKVMSMWRAVLRDTAQHRGRNPLIIESMAEKDIFVPGVIVKGKLLNLTSQEAIELEIADVVASDYEEILNKLEVDYESIVVIEENYQVKLAKYISNPYINSLFLTIAFVGMVIEIFSPGFGLGGTISIIGFGLYFGGNILAGHSNWTSLILFITGFILLIVEAIVPGFGLPGISGLILVFTGIIMAVESLGVAAISISIAIIVTTIITILLIKLGFKSKILDNIILKSDVTNNEHNEKKISKEELLGSIGKSVSILRPTGFIEIEGQRYDALSEEGFIQEGSKVVVSKIEGNKIFVRRM